MQGCLRAPVRMLGSIVESAGIVAGYLACWLACWALLSPKLHVAASIWLLAEAVHHALGRWRLCHLNICKRVPPDPHRMRLTMDRFLELPAVHSLASFCEGWFFGAPLGAAIRRGNVLEFMAFILFNKRVDEMGKADLQLAQSFLARVERAWGVQFAEGYNPAVSHLGFLWDPLRVWHKPLALYAAAEAAAAAAHLGLWAMGFRGSQQGGFRYWVSGSRGSQGRSPQAGGAGQHSRAGSSCSADFEDTHHLVVSLAEQGQQQLEQKQGQQRARRRQCAPWQLHHSDSASSITLPHHAVPSDCSDLGAAWAGGWGSGDSSSSSSRLSQSGSGGGSDRPNRQSGSVHTPPSAADAAAAGLPGAQAGPAAAGGVPIVFIHGVGLGLLPYLGLLREVAQACGGSRVIPFEVPHVAVRLGCWEAAGVDDVAHAVAAALRELGLGPACIMGHSYGTFCASRVCQLYPELVHSVCLLDPACLMTWFPKLTFNFIYQAPALSALLTSPIGGIVDWLRFLVFSRDLTIMQAFCRTTKFRWQELQLWPQDLPSRALVVLSGQDDLVPSELVQAQLKLAGHPAKVMYQPEMTHGGILLAREFRASVVAGIRHMVQDGRLGQN